MPARSPLSDHEPRERAPRPLTPERELDQQGQRGQGRGIGRPWYALT